MNKHDRICIVGAGAAGLSAALFLKRNGYGSVVVLEKAQRVGGKCCSVNYEGRSFDLGANYVTPAYKEVRSLAKEFGAELYSETRAITAEIPAEGRPIFRKPLSVMTKRTWLPRLLIDVVRYMTKRLFLARIIDSPGFRAIHDHQDLCVSFGEWLDRGNLTSLRTVFEVPITIMGYGYLDEIPAPYALKYMSLKTFWNLVLVGIAFPTTWPKRFVEGFQGLWEHVGASLDVRLGVSIRQIRRGEVVLVDTSSGTLEFDHLILACPLTLQTLDAILAPNEGEQLLFSRIMVNPYVLTAYIVHGLNLPERVVGMLPLPKIGQPWAITQQFAESDFVQFYSRVEPHEEIDTQAVLDAVKTCIQRLGGTIDEGYQSCTLWQYFPHISVEEMRTGFYEKLEALQGEQRTYYAGGFMAFELVEPIVEYSKDLVNRFFPPA